MRRLLIIAAALALCTGEARAQLSDEALLDSLQHASFRYFWETANLSNGLIPDRYPSPSPCSIASTGFGLSSICVGADHAWITRAQARDRVLTTLNTFWTGPQGTATSGTIGYKGLFYHFLDMNTATRTWDSELSTIDTALLFGGILDARMYFDDPGDPQEIQIRALADSIYYRADWKFMQNLHPGILMGWKPGTGFSGFGQWVGYNEAMILYLLALGSPTHPVDTTAWTTWTSGYTWATQYGYTYVLFPPLFGHQYSHCWIDFRNLRDVYMRNHGSDYAENSRRATLAQRGYCIANVLGFTGYSDSLWGITASDTPTGYAARGAPPYQNDDGTITPTAPLSSMPFTPVESMQVLRNLWNNYRTPLWSAYGPRDAFNLTVNPDWYDGDWIGIDQGPIVLMAENHRTGAIWDRIRRNPDLQRGLARAGFVSVPLGVPPITGPWPTSDQVSWSAPNPFSSATEIHFRLPQAGPVRLAVYDLAGREIARLVDGFREAGENVVTLRGEGLRSGVYYYRLQWNGHTEVKKCVRLE